MNTSHSTTLGPALATACLLGIALAAPAAAAGPAFTIPWHTIDAGGGESSGGVFAVMGTVGQPDAGEMSGGVFAIRGGFWVAPAGPVTPCPGDLDGDNDVDSTDLNILLSAFGCTGGSCAGDLDGDGDTDTTDLNILLSAFGTTC